MLSLKTLYHVITMPLCPIIALLLLCFRAKTLFLLFTAYTLVYYGSTAFFKNDLLAFRKLFEGAYVITIHAL